MIRVKLRCSGILFRQWTWGGGHTLGRGFRKGGRWLVLSWVVVGTSSRPEAVSVPLQRDPVLMINFINEENAQWYIFHGEIE